MECLDLQKLRRCCRPDATEFDETELQVTNEAMFQFFLFQVDAKKLAETLQESGYISLKALRSVENYLRFRKLEPTFQESTDLKRVINYLSNKTSFVSFLWALCTSGFHNFANLLLKTLETQRHNVLPITMSKCSIAKNQRMHLLVKQLKFVSDSKLFGDPVTFIRRFAIRFKKRFHTDIPENKRKSADAYFGTLSVELDNFSFMNNQYVSIKALQSEMRRVIPFTSNPFINEALLNGRSAEMAAVEGDMDIANDLIYDAVAVVAQTERCPETWNLVLLLLNVLLHDYELFPSPTKKKQFMQIGDNALRMMEGFDEEFAANFRMFIMQRIVYCALDLSTTGKPIPSKPSTEELCKSSYLLSQIEKLAKQSGPRRKMCYKLAMGRLMHLKGDFREARKYVKEAKIMAKQYNFVEFHNLEAYERELP